MAMKGYKVLKSASVEGLSQLVTAALGSDWQPVGSAFQFGDYLCQTVASDSVPPEVAAAAKAEAEAAKAEKTRADEAAKAEAAAAKAAGKK